MQNITDSNHFHASLNTSPFYKINNTLPIEYELFYNKYRSLIESNGNVEVFRKIPWVYINFERNKLHRDTMVWKIHVSATYENYEEILFHVLNFVVDRNLNFKFVASLEGINVALNKRAHPASVGKFIVIYCLENDLENILDELYVRLKGYEGAFVLSDKSYKDSKVIYYRFGEYLPIPLRTDYGTIENYTLNNKYDLYQDKRLPYYNCPEWIEDAIISNEDDNEYSELLEKYEVEQIISNCGSTTCYLGRNRQSNEKVFIKEARGFLGLDTAGRYSTYRINKEYQMLKYIESLSVSPKPLEIIEEGGNVYLIEEYISGQSLVEWLNVRNPLHRSDLSDSEFREYAGQINEILKKIIMAVLKVVSKAVFINDISYHNIIVTENEEVKLVDFEYAYFDDDTDIANIYTPGFNSDDENRKASEISKFTKLLSYLFVPYNNMFVLSKIKQVELIDWYLKSYGRYLKKESLYILELIKSQGVKTFDDFNLENLNIESKLCETEATKTDFSIIPKAIKAICKEFNKNYFDENKYLFPADPQIFNTNLYSLSHGCFGVIYALHKLKSYQTNTIDAVISECLTITLPNLLITNDMPNGLLMGRSGVACTLLDLGCFEVAELLMCKANNIEAMSTNGFFYGLSGMLFANIKFYLVTGNKKYKKTCYHIFEKLSDLSAEDILENGFGLGLSGISYVLIYYYQLTKDENILNLAIEFLNEELSRSELDDRGLFAINREGKNSTLKVVSPYVYDGIAGVGFSVLRMCQVTKNDKYKDYLEKIINGILLDITTFPTYMRGFSGILDFLMDCLFVIDNIGLRERVLEKIHNLANNLKLFYLSEYNLFYGEQLFKLSTDLLAGTSGIILVLERYRKMVEENVLIPSLLINLDKELGIFTEEKLDETFTVY